MTTDKITCPKCGNEVELRAALAGRLRKELEAELGSKHVKDLEAAKAHARNEAQTALETQLKDLANQVGEQKQRLTEAQESQIALLREKRQLEERQAQTDLIIEQRLQAERERLQQQIQQQQLDRFQLKEADYQKMISDLNRRIEELQRTAQQASQQSQGEVLELALEELLRTQFVHDTFEPVAKGRTGGDLVQVVRGPQGQELGRILWETKRTKSWSEGWLNKLREDQRQSKCDIAVLSSQALPEGISAFGSRESIWVCQLEYSLPVAALLRESLRQVSEARQAQIGRQGKMELVYEYLAGPEFKRRIEGIVEAFRGLQEDLEQEKRLMQRQWAKREKQIQRVIANTAGMHGEISGIIGGALPDIEALSIAPLAGEIAYQEPAGTESAEN